MTVLRITTILPLLFSVCLLFSTTNGRPARRLYRSAESDSDSDSSSSSSEENDGRPQVVTTTASPTTTTTPPTAQPNTMMTTLVPVMTTCVVRGDGTLDCRPVVGIP